MRGQATPVAFTTPSVAALRKRMSSDSMPSFSAISSRMVSAENVALGAPGAR